MILFLEAVGLDLVRIGAASDVRAHVAKVASALPVDARVLRVLEGGAGRARALRRRFAAHRAHGPWFRLSPIRTALDQLEDVPPELAPLDGIVRRCIDCGRVGNESFRARHRRCRACEAKRRSAEAEARAQKRAKCLECGGPISKARVKSAGSAHTGLCRPCGMRAAWASPEYRANSEAARRARQRRCLHCGEPGLGRHAKYHPACWAAHVAQGPGVYRDPGPVAGAPRTKKPGSFPRSEG